MPSTKSAVHLLADSSLLVLVTGATGQQGGSVARHLLKRGHRLRALVRDSKTPKAQALQRSGVELFQGDFENALALRDAAHLVDAVYLMGTPFESGPAAETLQGLAAVDALRSTDVPFLVYSSVAGANQKTGIPHFDSKFRVEQRVRDSGIPFAITAPVSFMDSVVAPRNLLPLQQGHLSMGTSPGRPQQMVALDDLGALVARVIEDSTRFRGQRIEVASDEISGSQAAEIMTRLLGRPIAYRQIPVDVARETSEDLARMFDWFERRGYSADIRSLRQDFPEVGWHRFEEWARGLDWRALLG